MRVGIIAPPFIAVPPAAYGGTESAIDVLVRALADFGHEVVLFATGDSHCGEGLRGVERAHVVELAPGLNEGGSPLEVHHVEAAYRALSEVDVIHDHSALGPLLFGRTSPRPVVATNHNPFTGVFATTYRLLAGKVPVIALSGAHASGAPEGCVAAVIHHGLFLEDFPIGAGEGGYALFLGRMSSDKGPERAARAALAAGVPLLIAGGIRTEMEQRFFDAEVRPLLGAGVEYLGEVRLEEKLRLLGAARCLLNPIRWPEPFGLAMVEALACGTPVIALRHGSAPEIVADGRTGFVVESEQELPGALSAIDRIDRWSCRRLVEERFDQRTMAAAHVALYESILRRHGGRP